MSESFATSAYHAISQLAARPAVHRAFQWFHLQEPMLREWQRQVVAIPAPPFGEAARAHWLAEQFVALRLQNVHVDACGNALGLLRGSQSQLNAVLHSQRANHADGNDHGSSTGCTLISAHLDTVFPAEMIGKPTQRDSLLQAPGACDNCAGITALLAIAAAVQSSGVRPSTDLLLAGNVGEEGEGNLRGMRYLFTESPFATRIRSAIILDGAGTETIVTQALGSKRFSVTVYGPGGHSWTDAGVPNPIIVLANALAGLGKVQLPAEPRTTWNVGLIHGGTSVNAIPQRAQMRIDTRSTDPQELAELEQQLVRCLENSVRDANRRYFETERGANANSGQSDSGPLQFQVENIGERPAARLAEDATILRSLRAIDRHLGIPSHARIASTDANIPLSLGIEAVSIGCGGIGGGVHTREEWFDATGRDLALRRILLLMLAVAEERV